MEVEWYCCSGFVMDILEYLVMDLVFDYLVYFRDEYSYNVINLYELLLYDVWNGLVEIIVGVLIVMLN